MKATLLKLRPGHHYWGICMKCKCSTWFSAIKFIVIKRCGVVLFLAFLDTHNVHSMMKRHGNDHFHVASTWNTRGEFLGLVVG